jgi:hypothetical protein
MVVIQDAFDPAVPLTHSRIGIDNIARSGTVDASSEAAGFPAIAAANPLTYEFWKPTAFPAWWRVDAGADVTVDYVGIAAHNLGTSGITVEVQSSDDNSTWTTVDTHTPTSDVPIMFLFAPVTARYWRITVTGEAVIGAVYIGKVIEMQRAAFAGINPIDLSRRTVIRPNRSEGGQWLGRSVIREGSFTSVGFRHLTNAWYRANFDPFVEEARSYPFFFAWRPEGYPDSVGYVWTQGDIVPTTMGIKDFLEVGLDLEGLSVE